MIRRNNQERQIYFYGIKIEEGYIRIKVDSTVIRPMTKSSNLCIERYDKRYRDSGISMKAIVWTLEYSLKGETRVIREFVCDLIATWKGNAGVNESTWLAAAI